MSNRSDGKQIQLLRKLKRDRVVSVAEGRDLVGVYFEDTNGSSVLLECSPERADRIVRVWNSVVCEEIW